MNPRQIYLAAAAIAALAAPACLSPARGGDLPGPAPLPAAPYISMGQPMMLHTWDGAYFGFVGGGSFDADSRARVFGATAFDAGAGTTRPAVVSQSPSGITGGATVGYNARLAATPFGILRVPGSEALIVGAEADASAVDGLGRSAFTGTNAAGENARSVFHSGTDFLGTVRGRIGYAMNDILFFGTGGFAYGNVVERGEFYAPAPATATAPAPLRYFGKNNGMQAGYAYGGGVEFAMPGLDFLHAFIPGTPTMKIEYLGYDLGTRTVLMKNLNPTVPGSAYFARTAFNGDILRAGVNYNF